MNGEVVKTKQPETQQSETKLYFLCNTNSTLFVAFAAQLGCENVQN